MKQIITIVMMTLAWVGLAQAAGDAEAGKTKSAVCAGCHGMDGNSQIAQYPKLAGQGEKYLVKQLLDMKSGDRVVNEMLGFLPPLNEQDIEDISAYYASLPATLNQAKPELVELGKQIYLGGNKDTGVTACAGCHSPTGAGNDPAGFPKLGGQHADYIMVQLKKFQLGARHEGTPVAEARVNDGETRMMRDIAFRMKDFEIEAVASYISGLH